MQLRNWRTRPHQLKLATAALIGAVTACVGCHRTQREDTRLHSIARIELFDDVATSPRYASVIAEADRDLPGDEWTTQPFRDNRSRYQRVEPIARDVLAEIRPKLKVMTVSNLVRSLKVIEDGSALPTNYIADAIYPEGNQMIISEIKSRSAEERRVLLTLPEDWALLDTGMNGPPDGVQEIVQQLAPGQIETGKR